MNFWTKEQVIGWFFRHCQRVWVMYMLVVILLAVCFFLNTEAFDHMRYSSLSRLQPAINYWTEFSADKEDLDMNRLGECVRYHTKIADYVPQMAAEGWNMVGFCSYRAGRTKEAIRAYQKALDHNQTFFWTYYNLGIIYFNDRKFAEAVDMFRQALEQRWQLSVMAITTSKVYVEILMPELKANKDIGGRLKQGYEWGKKFMLVSSMCYRDPSSPPCRQPLPRTVQIF